MVAWCAVGGPEMASLLTVDVMNLLVRRFPIFQQVYPALNQWQRELC